MVVSDTTDQQFESSHRQFHLLSTVLNKVYRKDENKEKEAENGPNFLPKLFALLTAIIRPDVCRILISSFNLETKKCVFQSSTILSKHFDGLELGRVKAMSSVTSKKSPNVYKSCPKRILLVK